MKFRIVRYKSQQGINFLDNLYVIQYKTFLKPWRNLQKLAGHHIGYQTSIEDAVTTLKVFGVDVPVLIEINKTLDT